MTLSTRKSRGQHLLEIINVLKFLTFQTKRPTLLMSEAKQKLILLAVPLSLSFTRNAFPINSKPPAPSCAKSHQNSTPVQLCGRCLCLPKNKAKKHEHCQNKIAKAFDNYLAQEDYLEDLFSNKPSGTINPVYLPQTTPEQHKECVNQKNTVYLNSCPIFYPAT